MLVTGHDLEQQEHRGIAVFSKNLIRALSGLGYEVWLLTSARVKDDSMAAEQILKELDVDQTDPGLSSRLQRIRSSWVFQFFFPRLIKQQIRRLLYRSKSLGFFCHRNQGPQAVELQQLPWSPRLSYLKDVAGFINVSGIFDAALLRLSNHRTRSDEATVLSLHGFEFDAVISTCPLPIRFVNRGLCIQVVHDLIPIQIPSEHPWDDPGVFSNRLKLACQADIVLAVSHTTARALVSHGFTPKRLKVIYQPMSFTAGLPKTNSSIPFDFPYVLSVGSIEPRKNIALAAQAFLASDLPEKNYRYVIVGELRGNAEGHALQKLCSQSNKIIATGYISDQQRDDLLRHARAFVFPSMLEGYGIPLVDAIQMEKKILCSDIEVFREIAQGNANFVQAQNISAWTTAFNNVDAIRQAQPLKKFEFSSFAISLKDCLKDSPIAQDFS